MSMVADLVVRLRLSGDWNGQRELHVIDLVMRGRHSDELI